MSLPLTMQRFACISRRTLSQRGLKTSSATFLPRKASNLDQTKGDNIFDFDNTMDWVDDGDEILDSSSMGHLRLQQQREYLRFFRLMELDIPKLEAYRKPFVPPDRQTPLIVRSIFYGGEEHPVTAKRVIVAAVAQLPLKTPAAIHKFKVLAGVRWSREPAKDAGVAPQEADGEHGYIKISCENYPHAGQNLKWASDTLDRLIQEANNSNDTFADIPLDTRHLDARAFKTGASREYRGLRRKPSIKDFPQEWLPPADELPEMQAE